MSPLRIPVLLSLLCVAGLVLALVAAGWLNQVGVALAAAPLVVLASRPKWFRSAG